LASTTPLAALIALATFLDDLRKRVAAGPRFRAVGGQKAKAAHWVRLDPYEGHGTALK